MTNSTIILDQTNIQPDGTNSTLVYKFRGSMLLNNHQIALQSLTMYNSWANISAVYGNNRFSYTWTVGSTVTTYNVIIPDGLYEITDIDKYLQFVSIQNGTYLIDNNGKNIFYVKWLVNPNLYKIQLLTFPVPIALPSGWTAPIASPATGASAFVGYPTVTSSPIVNIPTSSSFNKIVGFASNFTSTSSGASNMSFVSTVTPQVQPNPTLYINCDAISNPYASSSQTISSISPTVGFGLKIVEQPPEFAWANITTGLYSQIRITLTGQNNQGINILDPNMTFLFQIREIPKSELVK
jgi:hypothetical protein